MKKRKSNAKRKKPEYKGAQGIDRVKNRRDLVDQDYLNKLTPKERDWLQKFNAEYVGATFKKDENGNYAKSNLHKTAEQRKDCYSRNNSRNRCALTIAQVTGHVVPDNVAWEVIENERVNNVSSAEDTIIDLLDLKREIDRD
ncbi:MAG: hypothetical protein H7831_14670 [Magnetococcus sp. WYHC-3]